jgi:hypothetical protein
MTNSATQWGSASATRRALLIHGITMSSNSWEGLAQLLVAEGQARQTVAMFFFVNRLIRILRCGAESPCTCRETGQC